MKIAICSATPYQSLNALNLACNILDKEDEKDLFYRNFSEETDQILKKIKEYHIFDNIYEFNLVNKKNKIKYYINDFIQAVFPKRFVDGLVKGNIDITDKAYDYITITSGTEFEVALTRIFTQADTIAYDDGLGSYIGDIVHDHKLNIIWRLLGRRTDKIQPIELYVNNAGFCQSTLSDVIKEFPSLNTCGKEYRQMISEIFYKSGKSTYQSKSIVYLTQPYDEIDKGLSESVRKAVDKLKQFEKCGIVRKHPRDNMNIDIGFQQDCTNSIWELVCDKEITNKHILISLCSTAQIMPKILYGKEPWIVFLYEMFSYKNNPNVKRTFAQITDRIKAAYVDKNKICIPKSEDELCRIIKYIMDEENIVQ